MASHASASAPDARSAILRWVLIIYPPAQPDRVESCIERPGGWRFVELLVMIVTAELCYQEVDLLLSIEYRR